MDKQHLREALRLRQDGFKPDLIIGHSGFGNTLYLKEVWPNAKIHWLFRMVLSQPRSRCGLWELNRQVPIPACEFTLTTAQS